MVKKKCCNCIKCLLVLSAQEGGAVAGADLNPDLKKDLGAGAAIKEGDTTTLLFTLTASKEVEKATFAPNSKMLHVLIQMTLCTK
jgi:hypothetical protein